MSPDDTTTYHRHGNHRPFVYHAGEDPTCIADTRIPVAVADVRPDSEDMQRLFGLWEDITGRHISDWDRERLLSLFARYAAGESVAPPVETFGPGDVVRYKTSGYVFTVAENGYYGHATRRVYESTEPFTSEDYERVGGDDA